MKILQRFSLIFVFSIVLTTANVQAQFWNEACEEACDQRLFAELQWMIDSTNGGQGCIGGAALLQNIFIDWGNCLDACPPYLP